MQRRRWAGHGRDMAEQWIDAATAAGIVSDVRPPNGGTRKLCARAHIGLVKARAQLLVSTRAGRADQRGTNVMVPERFWWAEGNTALEQDWPSGDFSTWIDRVHIQAFGVRFALSGVLEMLSHDLRAPIARRLSVAGSQVWIPARSAIQLVKGDDPKAVIVERARLGFVSCRAVEAKRFEETQATDLVWEEREWDVPPWFWQPSSWLPGHENWELGQFGSQEPTSVGQGWMRISGVHFLAESLTSLDPPSPGADASAGPISQSPGRPGPGGRIPQAWWDDMWCDVWALIYQGDFKPSSQADVERAMLTWAEAKGQSLAEATARPKARKLFQALNGEATNFLRSDS